MPTAASMIRQGNALSNVSSRASLVAVATFAVPPIAIAATGVSVVTGLGAAGSYCSVEAGGDCAAAVGSLAIAAVGLGALKSMQAMAPPRIDAGSAEMWLRSWQPFWGGFSTLPSQMVKE
tara:strand:- start:10 stop:369 length:360 start_codon:yes stop_codon:yes gene_type:complete